MGQYFKKTKLQRDKVIEAFGDLENFKYYHTVIQTWTK
jgi:hypothetical protein